MIITLIVGLLMTFVGYVFGNSRGQKVGATKMAILISKSIEVDPQAAIDNIKKVYKLNA